MVRIKNRIVALFIVPYLYFFSVAYKKYFGTLFIFLAETK